MPENTVYVGRPTKWGNPYSISAGRSHSLKFYRIWLEEKLEEDPHFLDDLKDKNLACWCKLSQPCHVDVLLEKLKSSAPAKPVSPAVVEIKSRVDKPHEETGGEKSIVKDIFSELDKEVINNPESMIDTESRLKYTEIKQKYVNV